MPKTPPKYPRWEPHISYNLIKKNGHAVNSPLQHAISGLVFRMEVISA